MEYYITLTYNCNLKCSYCAAHNVVFYAEKDRVIQQQVLDKILNFVLQDSKNREEQSYIVFYGGEPSLETSLMEYVIEKTNNSSLRYILYTNGLLLKTLSPIILEKLDIVFISIDGDKKVHDSYKFEGSYDQVIENSLWLKNNSKAKTIARITLQEESDLFKSVINIYKFYDYVFWQIVNKPNFIDPKGMINRYKKNIKKLYSFWIGELNKKNYIKIVPFVSLVSNFSLNKKNAFKCGMGVTQIDFDIFGNAYMCDEYLGENEHICGTVDNPDQIKINKKSNYEIYHKCTSCSISSLCRGRCRHALETFPQETINVYCKMTKIFVNAVAPVDIHNFVTEIDERVMEITEQIP